MSGEGKKWISGGWAAETIHEINHRMAPTVNAHQEVNISYGAPCGDVVQIFDSRYRR